MKQSFFRAFPGRAALCALLAGVSFLVVGCSSTPDREPTAAPLIVEDDAGMPDELAMAEQWLEDGEYKQVNKSLAKWLEANPDSGWLDRAWFFHGEAFFQREKYESAFEAYEALLAGYPTSAHYETALHREVAIGQRYLDGYIRFVLGFIPVGSRDDGLVMLDQVVSRWPGSELAGQALMIMGDDYYDHEQYRDALEMYELVVEHYSHTPYFATAVRRAADTTFELYEGPAYDSSALTDATIRYHRYRQLFPQEAQQYQVDQRLEMIRLERARKEYEIGDFYARTGQDDAAAYYWQWVAGQWPDTQWSEKSIARLASVVDMPESTMTDDRADSPGPAEPTTVE